jgi:hypothetical protein
MFVNGKKLLDVVRDDGARGDFDNQQEYENDCFNVAKLIVYLVKNGSLGDYLLDEDSDIEDLTIRNQVKRVCNLYGIKV